MELLEKAHWSEMYETSVGVGVIYVHTKALFDHPLRRHVADDVGSLYSAAVTHYVVLLYDPRRCR